MQHLGIENPIENLTVSEYAIIPLQMSLEEMLLAPGENRHFEPGENSQFQPGGNRQSVPGGCSQPRFGCGF